MHAGSVAKEVNFAGGIGIAAAYGKLRHNGNIRLRSDWWRQRRVRRRG